MHKRKKYSDKQIMYQIVPPAKYSQWMPSDLLIAKKHKFVSILVLYFWECGLFLLELKKNDPFVCVFPKKQRTKPQLKQALCRGHLGLVS